MMKELICICCPRGCHLKVDEEKKEVTGNACPRGKEYGINEVTNPVRVVTSTVKITGANLRRLPVKTDKPIPKGKIFEIDSAFETARKAKLNKVKSSFKEMYDLMN